MSLLLFFKQFFVKNDSYNFLERRINTVIDRVVTSETRISRIVSFNTVIINR